MEKMLKLSRIVLWWGGALIFAWAIGRYIVWNALGILFGYDDTKKALVGMLFYILLSVMISFYRDYRINSRVQSLTIDGIDMSSQNRVLEVLVFALRATMAGYICEYWFLQGSDWASSAKPIYVSDLFPALLALGILASLNFAMTAYGLVFEPWRTLIQRVRVAGASPVPSQLAFRLLMLRLAWLMLTNLILFWFFIPLLDSKLPSTGLFITIAITPLVVARIRRNR